AIGPSAVALLTGARTGSVAFGPFGEVTEAVSRDGTLVQYDGVGEHVLGRGVLTAAVSFGPVGEVIDVFSASGSSSRFDALGAHLLAVFPPVPGALSAG